MTVSAKTTIATPNNSVDGDQAEEDLLAQAEERHGSPYFPAFCVATQACISRTES